MEEENEEVYSTIFNALRHGVRRNILRMLNEQLLSFTTMEETLSLSSSHLTYHLDALRELITKTDQGYRLSVFGKAAVEMIEKVENPPRTHKKWNLKFKQLSIILLTISILTSGLFAYAQFQLNEMRDIQTEYNTQITKLTGQLEPYESLRNLTISNPETRYLKGTKIVSGSSLHFLDDEDTGAFFYREDDIVFNVPYENTTIEMKFSLSPSEGYSQGLYLQKGNAYRNESGILVRGNPKDEYAYSDEYGTHIYNATVWQSPVIWETEARNGEKYSILLERSGWYTLSLSSPVQYSTGYFMKSRSLILRDGTYLPYPSRTESWVEFKIIKDKTPVLFIVK